MKFSILIPARGEVSTINETIKTAENISKIINANGFKTDVLVSDNRKYKEIPLRHSDNTTVIIADNLLAYQNFKFLLENCDSSHAIFLALEDQISPKFLLKSLPMFAEDRSLTSILGKIYTDRDLKNHILFDNSFDRITSNQFIKRPFGWGIYSLFETNAMRKAFTTDCDWTDYIITGNLCKKGILYLNVEMRFYPVNEQFYKIKSQKNILNPLPWVKYFGIYLFSEQKFSLLDLFRVSTRTLRDFYKWYLQGGAKN